MPSANYSWDYQKVKNLCGVNGEQFEFDHDETLDKFWDHFCNYYAVDGIVMECNGNSANVKDDIYRFYAKHALQCDAARTIVDRNPADLSDIQYYRSNLMLADHGIVTYICSNPLLQETEAQHRSRPYGFTEHINNTSAWLTLKLASSLMQSLKEQMDVQSFAISKIVLEVNLNSIFSINLQMWYSVFGKHHK